MRIAKDFKSLYNTPEGEAFAELALGATTCKHCRHKAVALLHKLGVECGEKENCKKCYDNKEEK